MTEQLNFRDPAIAKQIAQHIHSLAQKSPVKFCHVCGTHEWTITHHGLRTLLPKNVDVIAGPGCPVCIVPAADIDEAVQLALKGVVVACYGDVLRVPGSECSLLDARARGGDVRVVYGVSDAVKMAVNEKAKEFAFFAVGFETTTPATAVEVLNSPPENLSFLVSHRLIPPAMELLLRVDNLHIDGFIAPGHVSTIIGLKPYSVFPSVYRMPVVVAGFEPLDVLFAIDMLLKQLRDGEARLENEYIRAVSVEGNTRAQDLTNRVFDVVDGNWRGLGRLPCSALALKKEFEIYDARKKYILHVERSRDLLPGCRCHFVIMGKIKPDECPLFLKACKPASPKGACMVSMEGTCRIWARYKLAQSEGF